MNKLLQMERQSLQWVLNTVEAPALFVLWQDDVRDLAFVRGATRKQLHVLDSSAGKHLPSRLVEQQPTSEEVVVMPAALSSVPPEERPWVNLARNRLLLAKQTVLFVEPTSQEPTLRRDFPDIFAIVRGSFHLQQPLYEDDYLWNTGEAGRLAALAATLPPLFSVGSILVERGTPQFKGSPVSNCPRCGNYLHLGPTTLTFRFAPVERQTQAVEGWVCSCGERYVAGENAREAHRRAFRRE